MNINEKIYSLRKENNLSQEELANKLNVSRQTISKWEVGESKPDFDKIVPLCELFGISTEELLRDNFVIDTNNKEGDNNANETEKVDVVKAGLICLSIFLYFFAVAFIVIAESAFRINDGITVSVFLTVCGFATALIIFTCMTRPSKRKIAYRNAKNNSYEKKKDPVYEGVISIVALVTVCIYLFISFLTMAWHLTWLIWIIFAIVEEIIKLCFALKNNNTQEINNIDEGENENEE